MNWKHFTQITVGLVLIVSTMFLAKTSQAVTVKETYRIYNRIIIKNRLKYPSLRFNFNKDQVVREGNNKRHIVHPYKDVNANTNQDSIEVYSGALTLNKYEMAAMLGHELAHYRWHDQYYSLPGKMQENRADTFGEIYITKAGYSRCKAAKFFLRLYRLYGNSGDKSDPHSSNKLRYERLIRGCPS